MRKKRKNFAPTEFIGKGLNLVSDLKGENFYLVNEKEYDSIQNEDEIECELLYGIESEEEIQYFRYDHRKIKIHVRGELVSVFLQS